MHEKVKELENLLAGLLEELKGFRGENALLKRRISDLEIEKEKISRGSVKLREFEEWRARIKRRLSKVCLRIEKITDSEDGLFGDYDA